MRHPLVVATALGIAIGLGALDAAAGDGASTPPSRVMLQTRGAQLSIRVPGDQSVDFRGVVSFDEAGIASGQMQYPAPNLAGFIAAIVTHGVMMESAKKLQKTKLQADADKVLGPYEPVLSKFTYHDLMERTLARLPVDDEQKTAAADGTEPQMAIDKAPVFSMTQDERSIIIDAVVSTRPHGEASADAAECTVRVISAPLDSATPSASWLANDGERLKEEASKLLLESISLVAADVGIASGAGSSPYRTIRYREGGVERIERAQVISNDCGRMVIRNLRGVLMSVPVQPNAAVADVARCHRDSPAPSNTPS